MSEGAAENGGNGSTGIGTSFTDDDGRRFSLQKIYVKDFSFEVPGAPAVFSENLEGLEFELNIKNSHAALNEEQYEVVLHLNVHATIEDRTVFMIELDQAGVFLITGYSAEELRKLAGTFCPTTLFPYAREAVSSVVAKGGFPSLTLQPINFDAVYEHALAEAAGRV